MFIRYWKRANLYFLNTFLGGFKDKLKSFSLFHISQCLNRNHTSCGVRLRLELKVYRLLSCSLFRIKLCLSLVYKRIVY